MKLIIQKVTRAAVRVDDEIVGQIGRGLCVLAGIHRTDTGWVHKELLICQPIVSQYIVPL